MSVTTESISPMCYAISSSKTYLKNWKINVYNGQNRLMYSYQDGRFLKKIEDGLDKRIEDGQIQHDQDAADILEAALNAIN